jgi:hypothetical protein
MECERLKKLIKNWFVLVQDEAMAPARMVDFMRKHVDDCPTCLGDQIVELEIKRITEIVLPPSKIPKALRREEAQEKKKAGPEGEDAETEAVKTENPEEGAETEATEEETNGEETEADDDLDQDDEDDEI